MTDPHDHPDMCAKHGEAKVRTTLRVFGRAVVRFFCPRCDAEAQERLKRRG